MKWKRLGNTVFVVIAIGFLAWMFLESLIDARPFNWFGEFIWFIIGCVLIVIIGIILLFTGLSLAELFRNVWNLLTKTKKQREQIKEQREQEKEEEKARQKFMDDLRRRGLLK